MNENIAYVAKAIAAAIVAGLTAAATGIDDGKFSWADGIAVAIALVVGFSAVFAIPNGDKPKETL